MRPDPLRDHLTSTCDPSTCGHCAKLRRTRINALLAVAHAAWHLMDDSGELAEDDMEGFGGDYVHSKLDHDKLSAALDALEADGWYPHPDQVDDTPRRAAMRRAFGGGQ